MRQVERKRQPPNTLRLAQGINEQVKQPCTRRIGPFMRRYTAHFAERERWMGFLLNHAARMVWFWRFIVVGHHRSSVRCAPRQADSLPYALCVSLAEELEDCVHRAREDCTVKDSDHSPYLSLIVFAFVINTTISNSHFMSVYGKSWLAYRISRRF